MHRRRKALRILSGIFAIVFGMIHFGLSDALAAEAPILKGLSGSEKARVEKLINGAKKEGELVFITNSIGPDIAFPLFEDFKKQYGLSDLVLKHTMKRSGGVISGVKQDISAGRRTFDVVHVGSAAFFYQLLRRKELMKYDSPSYKNFIPQVTGEAKGAAAEPGYFISAQVSVRSIVYNPKYVKKQIKTWDDVLDPKFKGKIILPDVLKSATIINAYGGLRKVLPRSYFEKLAKLNPIFILSTRSQIQKVVQGEKWIAIMSSGGFAYKEAIKGAEIKSALPPGGTVALGYPMGILAKARHPNAAKLWINYMHSRRGHSNYLKRRVFATGMKNPKLTPIQVSFSPPLETVKIIPMEWDKIGPKQIKAWRAEWRDIFYKNK